MFSFRFVASWGFIWSLLPPAIYISNLCTFEIYYIVNSVPLEIRYFTFLPFLPSLLLVSSRPCEFQNGIKCPIWILFPLWISCTYFQMSVPGGRWNRKTLLTFWSMIPWHTEILWNIQIGYMDRLLFPFVVLIVSFLPILPTEST